MAKYLQYVKLPDYFNSMSKSIFISHTNDDKRRIAPYLARIMAELPDIKLWIDRPEEIPEIGGFVFDRNRINQIMPGNDWLVSILEEESEAALVLSFWTNNCVSPDKKVLRREVETAYRMDKLLPLRLDSEAHYHLETVQELSLDNPEHSDAKFETCINQIRSRLGLSSNFSLENLDLDNCPFLINRSTHVDHICSQAVQGIRGFKHYIIPHDRNDAFDQFIWRICDYDGPRITDTEASDSTRVWEKILLPFEFGHEEGFTQALEACYLRQKVESKIEAAFDQKIPVCIYTQTSVADNPDQIDGYLQKWVGFFDDRLQQFRQNSSEEKKPFLFTVLGINRKQPNWFMSIIGKRDKFEDRILENKSGKIAELGPLGKISANHVDLWKMEEDVKKLCDQNDVSLDTLVRKSMGVFGAKWPSSFNITEFAESVHSQWENARK